ncbi:DNA topoisomerase I [Marinobacterium arenosum]|uniref:DNA topoisomerase I n=1 Tax=Marinobacterium arenosum TaxID=2862496 RepID=UPI001C953E6F|nr:DNA topoisomerase I [Marinobacterium arenosum]MBY4676929.1 DNA topoisomerase I [Marinobacterium arenosum]
MLQDNMLYVILLAVVGLIALTANYVLATREQQDKAKSERLNYLSGQAEHIVQALTVLREAGCKPEIIAKIDEHAMSLIEEISILAPDSELYADITQLKNTADSATAAINAFASDRALKRAQIYINFAEKLVLQMARGGKLTVTLARNYQQELYNLKVSVVVEAHIYQGKRYQEQGEMMTGLSHFKHAKALLVGATLPAYKKKERLAELQQLIENVEPKRTRYEGSLADSLDKYL